MSFDRSSPSEAGDNQELDAAIAAYYQQLEKSGKAPEPDEFVLQYPEQEEDLRQFFQDFELLRSLKPEVTSVADPEEWGLSPLFAKPHSDSQP